MVWLSPLFCSMPTPTRRCWVKQLRFFSSTRLRLFGRNLFCCSIPVRKLNPDIPRPVCQMQRGSEKVQKYEVRRVCEKQAGLRRDIGISAGMGLFHREQDVQSRDPGVAGALPCFRGFEDQREKSKKEQQVGAVPFAFLCIVQVMLKSKVTTFQRDGTSPSPASFPVCFRVCTRKISGRSLDKRP